MNYLFPLGVDIGTEFFFLHGRFEVQGDAHFLSVHQRLDGPAAHHEAQRTFQAAVRELDVAELLLHGFPVHKEGELDVVQVVAVKEFPKVAQRGDAFDVFVKGGIPGRERSNVALLAFAVYGAAAEGLFDFSGEGRFFLVTNWHKGG